MQRIQELIQLKDIIPTAEDAALLTVAINRHPWFSSPYMLFGRHLMSQDSAKYQKSLPLFSCYAGDRAELYRYMHSVPEEPENEIATVEKAEIFQEEIFNSNTDEMIKTSFNQETETFLENEDEINTIKPEDIKIVENVNEEQEFIIKEELKPNVTRIEVIENELAVPLADEIFTNETIENQLLNKDELAALSNVNTDEITFETITTQLDEYETSAAETIEIEGVIEKPLHSFGDWLDVFSGIDSEIKHSATIQKYQSNEGNTDYKADVGKPEKEEVLSIIDKFIKEEPRIKPKQVKFFNPEDVAEESVREDFTFATETLANIYIKQGLITKAIEIFNSLSLRYPQKSSYFAVKIEELKNDKGC
jgi:hypothetical protein